MSAGSIKGKDFTFNDSDSEKEQTQCFEVTRASTKELATFIKAQYESFLDYELWATYTEIFKPVRLEQWTKLNSSNRGTLSQLRSILRNRGVWVDNEAKTNSRSMVIQRDRPNKRVGWNPNFRLIPRKRNYLNLNRHQKVKDYNNQATIHTPISYNLTHGLKTQTNNYNQQIIGVQALTNLAKLYSEPMKYTEEQDSFKYKVEVFEEKCSHAEINDDQGKAKAFSTMLTGDSLSYFYTLPLCNSFAAICSAMTNHF
ncbi:hypothetical protein GcM3_002017 [Golovinomyces cichoracearum]|uniref:Uncharacterized protein n=1 Tax=Golovinomyces cichoracearum TaxID=62708 RepID=A0A420JBB3_9PEZI|nr:hypothetical protein GcM3_002017 [Golovinomyces cichoracearum]